MKNLLVRSVMLAVVAGAVSAFAADPSRNPFLGYWELTIPGGGAGWLGVEQSGSELKASLLWGGGSVMPLPSAKLEDGKLVLRRDHVIQRKDASGKNVKRTLVETLTGTTDGSKIHFTTAKERENGSGEDKSQFSGKRTPPLPPTPDLSKVKFGEPIQLFNGRDLTGWRLTHPGGVNGWAAKDGLLVNNAVQEEGKPHRNYGNLRTEQEFEDFNLRLETRLPNKGNSGVYLRGIYEVQVADTHGQQTDSHNMGGLYSRIKPSTSAEKPAGEWQTMDITLVDRHLTVILNGTKIIDNQPVLGCTGGALWADVSRPGPIYLQGDHTSVEYRNMVLRPVVR
jgi:hypothetical protein